MTYAVRPRCGRTRVPSRRQLPTDHCHAVPIRGYQSGLKSPLPSARPSPIDVRAPPVLLTGRSISGLALCSSENLIATFRKEFTNGKGMTQQQLAERSGYSREYIARVETDRHPEVSEGLLFRIARALELPEAMTNRLLQAYGYRELPPLIPTDRTKLRRFFAA